MREVGFERDTSRPFTSGGRAVRSLPAARRCAARSFRQAAFAWEWPRGEANSLARANAAKFVERLCRYPGDPSTIAEAERHILDAHAERDGQWFLAGPRTTLHLKASRRVWRAMSSKR